MHFIKILTTDFQDSYTQFNNLWNVRQFGHSKLYSLKLYKLAFVTIQVKLQMFFVVARILIFNYILKYIELHTLHTSLK